ncbi:MAG: metallophosphoesterase [Ruminococcaceae bacterium]|nr:metallophosphoesterase [Oscillospiraceae bacterium]
MNKITSFFPEKRRLTKRLICAVILLVLIFVAVTIWGNITLCVEHFEISTDKVPGDKGYKIAHVSDYHNTKNGFLNDAVITSLEKEKPDIIVITGDLIDCRKTDINKGVSFATALVDIAPVYYVTGNHECNLSIENQSAFDGMIEDLKSLGVEVLRGDSSEITLPNKEKINIFGIDDPYFHCGSASEVKITTDSLCSALEINIDEFNILLAHHPEQIEIYSKYQFDLVYSGHAHGGQGRLFGIGLIAPDQGLFPKYTSGLYEENETTLVVSRGIGNSIAPVRIFDRPNLIYTIIK